MALHAVARQLFDMEYVEGGCVGEPPEGTIYDDTMGCWITNYTIGAVGVLGAILILTSKTHISDMLFKAFAVTFFLGKSSGYSIAGVLHQTAETGEQPIWWTVSFILTLVGNLGICLLAVLMLGSCTAPLYAIVTLFYVAAIVFVAIMGNMMAAGIATLLGLAFVTGVFGAKCNNVLPAVGTVTMIAGLMVQVGLNGTCGKPGYENCWEDCIIPAPYFNHNALFHALFAVGMLILALTLPSQAIDYENVPLVE